MGPTRSREVDHWFMNLVTTHVLRVDTQPNDSKSLDDRLRSFWDLEFLGIHKAEKTMYDKFTNTIYHLSRWQVPGIFTMERFS